MSHQPVIVINPNSDERVTQGLRDAISELDCSVPIECVTLQGAPLAIESRADIEALEPLLPAYIQSREDARAVVVACYSDPLIEQCRAIANVPVFGIQSSAVLTALAMAGYYGVLALSDVSIARHQAYLEKLGLLNQCIGERSLNLSVDDTQSPERVKDRLVEVGKQLISDGAGCLILGCAGLSAYRRELSAQLNIEVIDPTQASVILAMGQAQLSGEFFES